MEDNIAPYLENVSNTKSNRRQQKSHPNQGWRGHEELNLLFNTLELHLKPFPFQTSQLRYKNYDIELNSGDLLPRYLIAKNVMKKISKAVETSHSKDMNLFITQKTYDGDSSFYHIEDLTFGSDIDYDPERSSINLSYRTIGKEMYDEQGFIKQFQEQIVRSCIQCQRNIAQNIMDCSLENGEKTFKKKDPRALREYDMSFLSNMRVFLVLIRTNAEYEEPSFIFHRFIYFPSTCFRIRCINQPFKLVSSPLTTYLTKKNVNRALWSGNGNNKQPSLMSGYICLDKSLRMLPIMENDPLANSVPLLGVWVFGLPTRVALEQPDDQLRFLSTTLQKFILNSAIQDNLYSLSNKTKSFLLALFSHDEHMHFYEVELTEGTFRSGEIIDNSWTLLKNSENIRDAEQIAYSPLTFYFNPKFAVKDIANLHDSVLQSPSKYKDLNDSRQLPGMDSLEQYLGMDSASTIKCSECKSNCRGACRRGRQDESVDTLQEDAGLDYKWSLPRPQPQPSLRADDSKDLHRTATFWHGSDQTLDSNALQMSCGTFGGSLMGRNVLTESIKGAKPVHGRSRSNAANSHNNSEMRGYDNRINQSNQSDSLNEGSQDKSISPLAEKLLQQQAAQLKMLQTQILTLQNALLSCTNLGFLPLETLNMLQLNNQMGISNPLQQKLPNDLGFQSVQFTSTDSMQHGKPPLPNQKAQSVGTDPIVINSQVAQANSSKSSNAVQSLLVSKSTNTTFSLNKNESADQFPLAVSTSEENSKSVSTECKQINTSNLNTSIVARNSINEMETAQNRSISVGVQGQIDLMSENHLDQSKTYDRSNTSIHLVEKHDSSVNRSISRETGTEPKHKISTETQVAQNSVPTAGRTIRSRTPEHEEERPLIFRNEMKNLNESAESEKIRNQDTVKYSHAKLANQAGNQLEQPKNNKAIHMGFLTEDEVQSKSSLPSTLRFDDDKENVDTNRRVGIVAKRFVAEDPNDTLESLSNHFTKLRLPEEMGSSMKKISNPRIKIVGQTENTNQSLKIPRIKFDSKGQNSDSSEDDMKQLEVKYLKKRY